MSREFRTVDDLGRIVIPKTIRAQLGIDTGDKLEIWAVGDRLYMNKPRELRQLISHAPAVANAVSAAMLHPVVITDNQKIIAAAGFGSDDVVGLPIGRDLRSISEPIKDKEAENFMFFANGQARYIKFVYPLRCNDDIVGTLAVTKLRSDAYETPAISRDAAIAVIESYVQYLENCMTGE